MNIMRLWVWVGSWHGRGGATLTCHHMHVNSLHQRSCFACIVAHAQGEEWRVLVYNDPMQGGSEKEHTVPKSRLFLPTADDVLTNTNLNVGQPSGILGASASGDSKGLSVQDCENIFNKGFKGLKVR